MHVPKRMCTAVQETQRIVWTIQMGITLKTTRLLQRWVLKRPGCG